MYMLKKEESVMMCLLYIKGEIRVCLMRRKMKNIMIFFFNAINFFVYFAEIKNGLQDNIK